jgi:hypothetical protein
MIAAHGLTSLLVITHSHRGVNMFSTSNGVRRLIAGGMLTLVLLTLFVAPLYADGTDPEPPFTVVGPHQGAISDSTAVDTTMSAGQIVDPGETSVFWLIAYLISTTL